MNVTNILKSKLLLILISFVFIAWGQPGSIPIFGLVASSIAFGLFFIALDGFSAKTRFITGTLFFTAVQAVQIHFFLSHPFLYIYAVYALLSLLMGLQFGLISIFATKERLSSLRSLLLIPALWVLCEWSRLFFLSGFSFSPVGLFLATTGAGLQLASFFGVFGLSFLVLLTNSFFARAYFLKSVKAVVLAISIFVLPLGLGLISLSEHQKEKIEHDQKTSPIKALIVHSSEFPEELGLNPNKLDPISQAYLSWAEIFEALKPFAKNSYDLILFPEIAVNLPAEAPIFHLEKVQTLFQELNNDFIFNEPSGFTQQGEPLVSSCAIAKNLSKIFNSAVICGLEGHEYSLNEKRSIYYNSAYFFHPEHETLRYDKSILLPMGESIPFEWLKPIAASYGLFDSFGKGQSIKIFKSGPHLFGPSICYEDTFGNFIRQNRQAQASCLVNLTNDGWYPNSELKTVHLEHARLRSVECGVPLIRACNFGVSGAIDSLGKTQELLALERGTSSFPVEVSSYNYKTLYAEFGDAPIIILSLLLLALSFKIRQDKKNKITR